MVSDMTQRYRWDFIGLSTDTKPTPATSEKVVNGSTFYCADTSKLYVYCTDNWYERKPLGGTPEPDYDFETFTFTLVDDTEITKNIAVEKSGD